MKHGSNYLACKGDYWEKQRARALVRDDFHCQAHKLGLCEEPCTENRVRFVTVHHILMRINGGSHDLSNLLTICRSHHIDLHPFMSHDLRAKERVLDYEMREL